MEMSNISEMQLQSLTLLSSQTIPNSVERWDSGYSIPSIVDGEAIAMMKRDDSPVRPCWGINGCFVQNWDTEKKQSVGRKASVLGRCEPYPQKSPLGFVPSGLCHTYEDS